MLKRLPVQPTQTQARVTVRQICPTKVSRRLLVAKHRLVRKAVSRLSNAVVCQAPDVLQPGGEQEQLFHPQITVPPVMKGYGSFSGATLQRSKLDQRQKLKQETPKTDDSGGGGNIGKKIFNGGGGDGDDGDDDDYFAGGDGEEEGDKGGFWRSGMTELYDKVSIGAVLSEWYRTVGDMPLILRQAVEMGLYSSAQLVRFCQMDIRHNFSRAISRKLPVHQSRAFVGRLMADPAFFNKVLFEMGIAGVSSMVYEWNCRRQNFVKELDFAFANTLGISFATGAAVWLLAPSRSYGAVHKFPWQQMLDQLPNNIFARAGPLQQYNIPRRAIGFCTKVAELSAAGAAAGFLSASLSNFALALRKMKDPQYSPSLPVPKISYSAAGLGAFAGLNLNLRYQALNGMDRILFDRCTYLWFYLIVTGTARFSLNRLEEPNRRWCQGLPVAVRRPVVLQQKPVRRVKKVKKVRKPVQLSSENQSALQFQPAAAA